MVQNLIAMEPNSGLMFEMTKCIGDQPSVCMIDDLYDNNEMQCKRGIVLQDTTLHA